MEPPWGLWEPGSLAPSQLCAFPDNLPTHAHLRIPAFPAQLPSHISLVKSPVPEWNHLVPGATPHSFPHSLLCPRPMLSQEAVLIPGDRSKPAACPGREDGGCPGGTFPHWHSHVSEVDPKPREATRLRLMFICSIFIV